MHVIRWETKAKTNKVSALIAERDGRWVNAEQGGADARLFKKEPEAQQVAARLASERPDLVFTVEEIQ